MWNMAIKPGYVRAFSTCFSLSIKGYVSKRRKLWFWPHIYHLLSYTAIWIIIPTYQCPFNAIFCGFPNFPTATLSPIAGWNSRDPLKASSKASLPKEPAKSNDLAPGWRSCSSSPRRIGSGKPVLTMKVLWSKNELKIIVMLHIPKKM